MMEQELDGALSPIGSLADGYHIKDHIGPIDRLHRTSRELSPPCQLNGQTDWHARAHHARRFGFCTGVKQISQVLMW